MPFTQFTNLDYDQIRTSIKDYLRANSNFTDFDFDGSNFSILIDTLAYNTYINSFNTNMVVNESFLDSATLRENVVSLARNIGYVPRSKRSAIANIKFEVPTNSTNPTMTLLEGLVCVGQSDNSTYVFSTTDQITAPITDNPNFVQGGTESEYIAYFGTDEKPIEVYQGTVLTKKWTVDNSQDQKFVIDNTGVDITTLRVNVSEDGNDLGRKINQIDNILFVDSGADVFFVQEVQDERYQLIFGDGVFGKKLETGSVITAKYIVGNGESGNNAKKFDFQGTLTETPSFNTFTPLIPADSVSITTLEGSKNGAEIENIDSIKYYAPRVYSSQYRAVTSTDYEAIINQIYPRAESISVVGGEELTPPRFGTVLLSIKPVNGTYISDFDKTTILSELKKYSVAGINQEIVDLKMLYVEIDASVYYNSTQVSSTSTLQTLISSTLSDYSKSVKMNRFGGRFKYSKICQLIDRVDDSITSNITKVIIRRNMQCLLNNPTQYELCFGNRFHINSNGFNIKSTGFTIRGNTNTCFFTDIPNKNARGDVDGSGKGILSVVTKNTTNNVDSYEVILKSVGTVDYTTGEILINSINIASTVKPKNIIEIQAVPESNDVIGLKDLYLNFDVSSSKINMLKDVIASGEDISGVTFTNNYYTSSYLNGVLERR